MIRQSLRLPAKSNRSAGSDNVMRSGNQPSKPKLAFADAVVIAPAPEERRHESESRLGSDEARSKAQRRAGLGSRTILCCDLPTTQ